MQKHFNLRRFSLLLAFCFLINGTFPNVYAQEDKKPRVIISNSAVKAKPTPTPIGSAKTQVSTKSTPYLVSKLNGVLANPLLKRGRVGVKVVSMSTGKTIFERNAYKYFMPASNMKSYSVAAAIDQLTPNFRFVTSVYANEKPNSKGVVRGNLIVYGRGDPSISTSFNDNDYYKGIDKLVEKIVASGVKKADGNLIGDETYFNSTPIPIGWEWDDLQWYYGAEVSPLTINNNTIDLKINPSEVGSRAIVEIFPANKQFRIINKTQTTPEGTARKILSLIHI